MRPWKPILAALVIFVAGLCVGAIALKPESSTQARPSDGPGEGRRDRHGGGPPPGRSPWTPTLSEEQVGEICGRMMNDLGLSLTQSNQVRTIMIDGQARMKAIAEEFTPRAREEFRRTREEIRAVLTPEQVAKFEEGFKKRQSRWRREEGPPPEGGPPPQGEPPTLPPPDAP